MQRNYETLDAVVVVACLAMVTGLGTELRLLKDIPTDHLLLFPAGDRHSGPAGGLWGVPMGQQCRGRTGG
nr:hypothetical protein [uncultured Brevundimonas sp.]